MASSMILRLALPTPLRRLFDYLPPLDAKLSSLKPGIRLKVPFQSRTLVGILIEVAQESTVPLQKLKPAISILDEESIFAADIFKLCEWAAEYYHASRGEVLLGALPSALRKGKRLEPAIIDSFLHHTAQDISPPLNEAQQKAIENILAAKNNFQVSLLEGVTGSGKTEIYLQVMTELLKENKQILVLVPEISLTPQTIARFRARFSCAIAALHSNLNDTERFQAWQATRAGLIKIVIGTRSAIFTPFTNLGLIIVDEEHDASFKQQDRFRYHARDMAIMRAQINHIPIILGSATPSLESLLNVKRNRYQHLQLNYRAGVANLPSYQLIQLTAEDILSSQLIETMREHLAKNNQVMLFLNRRGFAPVMYCPNCRWIVGCNHCTTRMVYHRAPPRLHCHQCDSKRHIPGQCEKWRMNRRIYKIF